MAKVEAQNLRWFGSSMAGGGQRSTIMIVDEPAYAGMPPSKRYGATNRHGSLRFFACPVRKRIVGAIWLGLPSRGPARGAKAGAWFILAGGEHQFAATRHTRFRGHASHSLGAIINQRSIQETDSSKSHWKLMAWAAYH
jgi:hypothetical protein